MVGFDMPDAGIHLSLNVMETSMMHVSPDDSLTENRARPRVAVAGFQHETNSFSPVPTSLEDFKRPGGWPGLTESSAVIGTFSGVNIPIGGCIDRIRDTAEIAPVLWASAEPGHLVETEAFETISGKILDGLAAAMPLDGIYFDLHGAMITEDHEDGEGELLARVRDLVGADVPIAVSLDLHANVTSEMVAHADATTIFRTYPHLDMAETGARAADLLLEIIRSGRKPHTAFRKLPYMIPLQAQHTKAEPVQSLYDSLPRNGSCVSGNAEIALGFPPGDIAMCGPALIATNCARHAGETAADDLERRFLEAESTFPVELTSPTTAIKRALETGRPGRPVVLADVQDNSGAGASSDTTGLLTELASSGARDAALGAICDPEFVKMAHSAGVGSEINASLGGKTGGRENPSFDGRFVISALSDGSFDWRGEMMQGVRASLGPTAAVRLVDDRSDIQVVVTGQRVQCLDRALFSHLGIEPAEMAMLVVKSTVHFRADFEGLAAEIIPVKAPGYNPCQLDEIPYSRLRDGVRFL